MVARDAQLVRRVQLAVTVAAAACVVLVFVRLHAADHHPTPMTAGLTLLVAAANASVVRFRLRSAENATTWTDAAILVCIIWVQPGWVLLCVAVGVVIVQLVGPASLWWAAYYASKFVLAGTAGLTVAVWTGLAHSTVHGLQRPVAVVAVAASVAVVERLIALPVLALVSDTSLLRILREHGGVAVGSFVGKLAVTWLGLVLFDTNKLLVAVIPPVALCVHLVYASLIQARAERQAWQRLVATTRELNSTDLGEVLAAAVVNAARLFSADEAEIFLRDGPDGPIVVRGDAERVIWSGEPGQAPPRGWDARSVTARLAGADQQADQGEIRLHYAGPVSLSERERLTMGTFVSAVRTAVRNAAAFAEARRLALRNAHAGMHDPLTGLANRRRLSEYGALVLARPTQAAVIVFDLDRFHEVNESLGHPVGDRLLAEIGRRLLRLAGPDDLVARLGSDEFAVLLVAAAGRPRPHGGGVRRRGRRRGPRS